MLNNIFRAYDIRGKHHQLSPSLASIIAIELINIYETTQAPTAKGRKVIIGADFRPDSTDLAGPIITAFSGAGWQVEFIPCTITPIIYYLDAKKQSNIAIMITASHNSADYCGLKIQTNGKPFCGKELQALAKRITKAKRSDANDELTEYIKTIADNINITRRLKICFLKLNPSLVKIVRQLANSLELDYVIADVLPKEQNIYDLVLSFDADGDRLIVYDNNYKPINGDIIFYLFAEAVLKQQPAASLVVDVKSSRYLFAELQKSYGADLAISRTGHSFIKQLPALLKGEMSGHYYFSDRYYGFDDGIYAAARLIELVASSRLTLKEMIAELPYYPSTTEIHLQLSDGCDKFLMLQSIKQIVYNRGLNCSEIDGIIIKLTDVWLLVRASNTEEILVIRAEGRQQQALNKAIGLLKEILTEIGVGYEHSELATCL